MLVLTFDSTTAAMQAEQYFRDNALPGRIIPVPPTLKAGCGLAWMSAPDMESLLTQGLINAGIAFSVDRLHSQ